MNYLIADELLPELFLYALVFCPMPSIDGDCDCEWLSLIRLLFYIWLFYWAWPPLKDICWRFRLLELFLVELFENLLP